MDVSPANIKYILGKGNPIIVGVTLDWSFGMVGKFVWRSNEGSFYGRRAMVICGWDDNKHAYKIINSHGRKWGFDGYGWIDFDYLQNVILGEKLDKNFGNFEMYVMETSPNFSMNLKISPISVIKDGYIGFKDFTEPKPTSRRWSFEQGTPENSTDEYALIQYKTPGKYKVTLNVNACSTYSSSKDTVITVLAEKPKVSGTTWELRSRCWGSFRYYLDPNSNEWQKYDASIAISQEVFVSDSKSCIRKFNGAFISSTEVKGTFTLISTPSGFCSPSSPNCWTGEFEGICLDCH